MLALWRQPTSASKVLCGVITNRELGQGKKIPGEEQSQRAVEILLRQVGYLLRRKDTFCGGVTVEEGLRRGGRRSCKKGEKGCSQNPIFLFEESNGTGKRRGGSEDSILFPTRGKRNSTNNGEKEEISEKLSSSIPEKALQDSTRTLAVGGEG